jgi:hypothetical protein
MKNKEKVLWEIVDNAIGDVQEDDLYWSIAKHPHNKELIETYYKNALILKLAGVDYSGLDDRLGKFLNGDGDGDESINSR